jgi:predicted porin
VEIANPQSQIVSNETNIQFFGRQIMKKKFLGMALCGLCAVPAFADSSTTFFGAVDVSIRHIRYSDNGSATSMGTFGNSPSMFGVRGKEDLGGGMNAIFLLEGAYVPDTGQSATGAFGVPFFNRSAWVGLNGSFGEVHLGRDWSPNYVNMYSFDPTYNLGVGNISHYSNVLNQGLVPNYYWNANSITYSTPAGFGGLYGSFQVSAGEGGNGCNGNTACGTTIGSSVGGRIGYAAGPFEIAGALAQTDITSNTRAASPSGKWTQANVGMSYNFNVAKIMLWANTDKFVNLRESRASIAAVVPVQNDYAWISVAASRAGDAARSAGMFGAHGFAAGYVHNLSKRTALYASVAGLSNNGQGQLSIEDVGSYSSNTVAGGRSTGGEVGIRHSF